MITSIPDGQICQAFDPMVILPGKIDQVLRRRGKENTSCLAPAYVYIEGSHGKRFLCDFHYFYEKQMVEPRMPEQWSDIETYIVDELDSILDTFGEPDPAFDITSLGNCWCGQPAHLRIEPLPGKHVADFNLCNFHYRKTAYRYLSNGTDILTLYKLIDARKLFNITSIREEADKLTAI